MRNYSFISCAIILLLSSQPIVAQEDMLFGWWKIERVDGVYARLPAPDGCLVLISKEVIAFFRPETEIVGDFTNAKIEADAWSHDISALDSKAGILLGLLGQDRLSLIISQAALDRDRIEVKLLPRSPVVGKRKRSALTINLVRADRKFATEKVRAMLGGEHFHLSESAITALEHSYRN